MQKTHAKRCQNNTEARRVIVIAETPFSVLLRCKENM